MKNLMKFLVVVVMILITTESFGQTFTLKTGLNLSNMVADDDDDDEISDKFKMKPGFHIGTTVEFPVTEMFSIETGLLLSGKGVKMSEKETDLGISYETKGKMNLIYLDIPINAKASYELGDAKFYGTFGPYIGIGLIGIFSYETTYLGETETEKEDVQWGSDPGNDELKRLDFGLAAGAGVEFNSIQIGLSFGLGLANISAYTENGMMIKNRVLGLSAGYKFGGKPKSGK